MPQDAFGGVHRIAGREQAMPLHMNMCEESQTEHRKEFTATSRRVPTSYPGSTDPALGCALPLWGSDRTRFHMHIPRCMGLVFCGADHYSSRYQIPWEGGA